MHVPCLNLFLTKIKKGVWIYFSPILKDYYMWGWLRDSCSIFKYKLLQVGHAAFFIKLYHDFFTKPWIGKKLEMRRSWRDFVISWNRLRILICLSYSEHMWVVHILCWGNWTCLLSLVEFSRIILKTWTMDGLCRIVS